MQIISDYFEAWNTADDAVRHRLLQKCWAEGGVYIDPRIELRGRDLLFEYINRIRSGRPGAWLELASGVDVHHQVLRFDWKLFKAGGILMTHGVDYGELDADGRLQKIIGFFGPLPS